MKTPDEPASSSNVQELVNRIIGIREGLTLSLATLREKIGNLEMERSTLLKQAEELKKTALLRADSLQNEVNQLREEIKALRELLNQTTTEQAYQNE
jgi:uncharacterized membrane protein YgaE (UPF0421/DUF939 family)